MWAGMKMRRSNQRKKEIGSLQIGIPGTSPAPSYEAFTIPTPRGSTPVGAPGKNLDTSFTGRKGPASDVQGSAGCGNLLQHVVVDRLERDGASTCQHSLDGGVGSDRTLQQASGAGVKQIVVRLSNLRQLPATVGGPPSVNYPEPVRDMGTEANSQHETHRAVWGNVSDCTENRLNDHIMDCSHPDLQSSSQYSNIIPNCRILPQPFQYPCERFPKEESTGAQNEGKPGSADCVDDSGGCVGNLLPVDESRNVLDSTNGHARCGGFGHKLPAQMSACSSPHPSNPSWILNTNVCRNYPVTMPMSNPAMCGCNACVATRFTAPCSYQRGALRAVRFGVEPAPLNHMKPYPSGIEPPACCQRMDCQGAKQPVMYTHTTEQGMDVDPQAGRDRNSGLPPRAAVEGQTCASRYMSSDDVLVCPAPWVHEWRMFPGTPTVGVNWAPESQGESQARQHSLEESHRCEMPDPGYPPAHCGNYTSNLSADQDADTQLHLEEHIANEIVLLSQKLANLQSQYGSRRAAHSNSNPAVMSCPQTPLLMDNTIRSQEDEKNNSCAPSISQRMKNDDFVQSRPATSSSSRISLRQSDSRLDERKLGGRNIGTNKVSSSTSAPSSSRGSDSGATPTINSSKNHSHPRTGSRGSGAHNGGQYEVAPTQGGERVFRESAETGKASSSSRIFSRLCRRRDKRTEEHVDEQWSCSDEMKDRSRVGGANVQRYPNGSKPFDWVKTLRFGGAGERDNQWGPDLTSQMQSKDSSLPQKEFEVDPETWLRDSNEHDENFTMDTKAPTLVSKSVQAGGTSPGCVETCAWTMTDVEDRRDSEIRQKNRADWSIDNRNEKGCKGASPENMGGLDSRTTHHLLKAGLRRAPSLWKIPGTLRPSSNNALRSKKTAVKPGSPRRDNGKRLRRRTLSDLHLMAKEEKIVDKKESESQAWQVKEKETRKCEDAIDAQWQPGVGDFEAEYEKFVENTEDVGHHDKLLDPEEYSSIMSREVPSSGSYREIDAQKRSSSIVSTLEKTRFSDVPVLSLAKTPPATRKTFIRCIELVVATKKKNQQSQLNGRKINSGGGPSYRRVACSERPSTDGYISLGEDCYVKTLANGVAAGAAAVNPHAPDQLIRKPKDSRKNPTWNTVESRVSETQEMKTLFQDSLLRSRARDEVDNVVFQEHLEHMNNLAFLSRACNAHGDAAPSRVPDCSNPAVADRVPELASVISRVMPKEMDRMDAEQLRARWEELSDALEQERLGLPKINTGGRKSVAVTRINSPRDSGCVKRIADQIKSLRATKLDKVGKSQKEKDSALEGAAVRQGFIGTKTEQKQYVVF